MLRITSVPVVCALLLVPAAALPAAAQVEVRQQIQIGGPGGDGAPLQILPPGRQAKTGTGRLRGRVVAADTGTALRRAQVRISGPDIGTKTALTDAQVIRLTEVSAHRLGTLGARRAGRHEGDILSDAITAILEGRRKWIKANVAFVPFILGVMIWRELPEASLWVIGLFVGIDLVFNGWSWVMLGLAVRRIPSLGTTAEDTRGQLAGV